MSEEIKKPRKPRVKKVENILDENVSSLSVLDGYTSLTLRLPTVRMESDLA